MLSQRAGFTLFEVMLSMLIMAIAVLSVAALLPSGLQAQQAARTQTIAAVTALNLINLMESTTPCLYRVQVESSFPWSTTNVTHEPGRWDVERILSSSLHGHNAIVPLPPTIARRLDSEGDEIQQILDRGGQVYFPSPLPSRLADFEGSARRTGDVMSMAAEALPYAMEGFDEAQRLVIGFVGYAQQNGLMHHPMTAAPYREWYPSPPIDIVYAPRVKNVDNTAANAAVTDLVPDTGDSRRAIHRGNLDLAAWAAWNARIPGFPHYAAFVAMYRTYTDPTVTKAAMGTDPRADADKPPWGGLHHEMTSKIELDDWDHLGPKLQAHYEACLALAEACFGAPLLGIDPATWDVRSLAPDSPLRSLEPWTVSALRFLGAAAMLRTRPGFDLWAAANSVAYDQARMLDLHELSLRAAAIYAAHRPHDWGAPRMYNGATMMDNPLVQLDLFGGLLNPTPSTPFYGYGPSYRLVAPQGCSAEQASAAGPSAIGNVSALTDGHLGASLPAGVRPIDVPTNYYGNWSASTFNAGLLAGRIDGYWGAPERFNLLDTFDAAERCRQLVVWSVDWQRYEDAERAPAAATDASWYPWDSRGTWGADSARSWHELSYIRRGYHTLGWFGPYSAHLNWRVDPEITPITVTPVGGSGSIMRYMRGVNCIKTHGDNNPAPSDSLLPWIGSFGLDANGSGLYEVGTVPPSVRMRATTVARFNLYDQRVFAGLRD